MAAILVADDGKGMRDMIRMVLERAGHQVVEAINGNEALAAVRRVALDLVVTDIIMPDCDGIEAITLIKREKPAIKILAISGGGQAHAMDLLTLAPMAGADATLAKPFRTAALLNIIDQLVGAAGAADEE